MTTEKGIAMNNHRIMVTRHGGPEVLQTEMI